MLSFLKTIAIILGFSVAGATIADCSAGLSMFQLTKLALTPDPPIADQPVLMTVQFNNPGPAINEGTVTTRVTLNGLPFSPTSEPLCTNTLCPLTFGSNDRSATSTWPSGIKGKLATRIEWTDVFNELLLCIEITEKMTLRQKLIKATEQWNETILWKYFHKIERIFNTSNLTNSDNHRQEL
jgi:hypothetical protein